MSGGLPEGLSNLDDLWDDSPTGPAQGSDPEQISADNSSADETGADGDAKGDARLYLPGWKEGWQVRVKTTWEREYCFAMNPDEEFHHLLMAGELYVEFDEEKFCLECARRRGVISDDRLYWKRFGG